MFRKRRAPEERTLSPETTWPQMVDIGPSDAPAVAPTTSLAIVDPWTGERSILTSADVCHVRAMSHDGILGLSPVRQCRVALGLANSLTQYGAQFFANGARPSGILQVPQGPAVQDQIDNLKEAWEARHGGLTNAHRIAVLSGDVSFA